MNTHQRAPVSFAANQLPLPYFVVDENLDVLQSSAKAAAVFPAVSNFLELVDVEYRATIRRVITPFVSESRFEARLRAADNHCGLHDVFVRWQDTHEAMVVCVPRGNHETLTQNVINELHLQLLQTDEELIRKTHELEVGLNELRKSAVENERHAILGRLAAGIAHEIRNPLTSIRGFVQLLNPYLSDLGKGEYVNILLSEIDRANNIINEFLSTSRTVSPKQSIVRVTDFFHDVLLLCQSEAVIRSCGIQFESMAGELSFSIDREQMKQVFLNLIYNAFDAIEQKGSSNGLVKITVQEQDQRVLITVSDNGIGIAEDQQDKVFAPFFTTKEKGTGLGLSVCKNIIEQHEGTIHVTSTHGSGTTFHMSFPTVNYV